MSDKLLTEHHLKFLSLKGGCTGLSESTPVKMPQCWKSHVMAQIEHITIDSEIFVRFLFLQNFAQAKFRKIKYSRNGEINMLITDIGKSCPICKFLTLQICLLMLFPKIKFSRKF